MRQLSIDVSEPVPRLLRLRRELLRTHDLVSQLSRELEQVSDLILCARKAARVLSSAFGGTVLIDLSPSRGAVEERVAVATSLSKVQGARMLGLRNEPWSEEARKEITKKCIRGNGLSELVSGPARAELLEALRLKNLGSVWTSVLEVPRVKLGLLTLIGASQPVQEQMLREVSDALAYALSTRRDSEELKAELNQRELFFSAATHDLRVPLTTLILQLDLLRLKLEEKAPKPLRQEIETESLDRIDRALQNLQGSVQGLYDCSQISSGAFKLSPVRIDLSRLVREIVETAEPMILQAGSSVKLTLPRQARGSWDALQISRVIHNLIHNALKYAPKTAIEISLRPRASFVELSVRDHGRGIDRSDRERIFDSFFRSARDRSIAQGLGLGLYICKGIVEAHGGTLHVRSPKGGGTDFIARLPYGKGHPGVARL